MSERRDTAESDKGVYVKSGAGSKGGIAGSIARFSVFMRPCVDGGSQKTYDVAVFRSGRQIRSDVRARVRLHGEQRMVDV